jgi:hypothetical protein
MHNQCQIMNNAATFLKHSYSCESVPCVCIRAEGHLLQGDRYAPPATAPQAGSTCCPHVLPLLALGRTLKKFAVYRILKGLSHKLYRAFADING